jgi:LacI family transcriptional regulator
VLDLDDARAGRHAVELLQASGCQRICYVGHPDVPASARRLAGAQEAADNAGLSLRAIESGMNAAAGVAAAADLPIDDDGPPLGVIAANDWLALGVHTGLVTASPRRRHRVEIVSFDGLPIVAEPTLGIRSLAAPLEAMARDAVAELRRLAANPAACGRSVTYPMRLAGH